MKGIPCTNPGHRADKYIDKDGFRRCRSCRHINNASWLNRHPDKKKALRQGQDKWYDGELREAVIQRDGEECVNCGLTRSEHREKYGRDITVNHIDGKGSMTPEVYRNENMDNLETLCCSCHTTKDNQRRRLLAITGAANSPNNTPR